MKMLGFSKDQSSRSQREASVSDQDFEQHVARVKEDGKELKTFGLLRLATEADREAQRAVNREMVKGAGPLPEGPFSTLVIDPPWDYADEGDADPFGRGQL